jgi:hypothetical protein
MRIRTGERVLALEGRDLVIFAMAKLTESRDQETGAHLERMREYSRILAEELSSWPKYRQDVDGDYVQLLYLTCPLHDIGKVAIPDAILLKPGKLTADEFEVMKQHTVFGSDTLGSVAHARPEAEFLTMARDIALTHHGMGTRRPGRSSWRERGRNSTLTSSRPSSGASATSSPSASVGSKSPSDRPAWCRFRWQATCSGERWWKHRLQASDFGLQTPAEAGPTGACPFSFAEVRSLKSEA